MPLQIKRRSNKFFWSRDQLLNRQRRGWYSDPQGSAQGEVFSKPQLTFVQLSKVSRTVYTEVAQTHLFYKINRFEFLTISDTLTYLAAVTPDRLSAIRSIKAPIVNDVGWRDISSSVYTLLAACTGLKSLELVLSLDDTSYIFGFLKRPPPGLSRLLTATQGLKYMSVSFNPQSRPNDPSPPYKTFEEEESTARNWCAKLEHDLRAESARERFPPYSINILRNARRAACLDLDGERRMGHELIGGAVATRTRQCIRNPQEIRPDGIIPQFNSKYGACRGWVSHVLESRKSCDDIYGIEFLVESHSYFNANAASLADYIHPESDHLLFDPLRAPPKSEHETIWMKISDLDHVEYRGPMLRFYQLHPNAYGKRLVLDIWKLEDGADDGDDHQKEVDKKRHKRLRTRNSKYKLEMGDKYTKMLTKMLDTEVKRDIRLENQKAAAIARDKAKIAKEKA